MTEAEWLACTDPEVMLRFRPASRDQLDHLVNAVAKRRSNMYADLAERITLMTAFCTPEQLGSVDNPLLPGIIRCVLPYHPVHLDHSWLTPTVTALAQGIGQDRAFDRLPILADALEDAGCDNQDILSHCRGEGPHVRGCWAIDLILSKS